MTQKSPHNLTRSEYDLWHTEYIQEVGSHCFTTLPNALTRRPNRRPSRWLPRLSWMGMWR